MRLDVVFGICKYLYQEFDNLVSLIIGRACYTREWFSRGRNIHPNEWKIERERKKMKDIFLLNKKKIIRNIGKRWTETSGTGNKNGFDYGRESVENFDVFYFLSSSFSLSLYCGRILSILMFSSFDKSTDIYIETHIYHKSGIQHLNYSESFLLPLYLYILTHKKTDRI